MNKYFNGPFSEYLNSFCDYKISLGYKFESGKDKLKSFDEYTNSQIITPKKRYIFNRIHPFKLLGAFKKELTNFTNYSHQNSKLN